MSSTLPSSNSRSAAKRRRIAGILISTAISVGLVVFLFYNLDWRAFAAEFGRVQWGYVVLIVAIVGAHMWLRAVRWRYLLPNREALSVAELCEATVVGFCATAVLPLRAGEFVRPWYLSRRQPVGFTAAFASVVTERVFDVAAILGLFGLSLLRIENAPQIVVVGAAGLAMVAGVIVAVMIVSYFFSEQMIRFAEYCLGMTVGRAKPELAQKILRMVREFIEGLRAIRSLSDLVIILVLSAAWWLLVSFLYQVGLWAFGIYPSFWVGIVVSVAIALAIAAPASPGFVGTFQAGCVVALSTIYQYPKEFSLAYSVFVHAVQLIPVIVAGIVILHLRGLTLTAVSHETSQDEA